MQSEHKTQIYLSREQYRRLQRRARIEGCSMAALVRAAVERYLAEAAEPSSWAGDSLAVLAGACQGRPDDSASIDAVLYGSD